ncbi:MAG: sugar transferase [Lyngbya sp.]|nr:sugar transferase [Lyngbya sp.]
MLNNVPNPEKKHNPEIDKAEFNDQRAPSILLHLDKGSAVALIRNLILLFFDATFISLGWLLAKWLVISTKYFQSVESFDLIGTSRNQPGFLLPILAITIGIIAAAGLYSRRDSRRRFLRLISCLTLAQFILIVLAFLYRPGIFLSRSLFLFAWFFTVVFVLFGRFLLELAVITVRSQGILTRKIFLIGTPRDTLATKIELKLISNREFQVVGQIDLSTIEGQENWPQVLENIQHQDVAEVFVCSWQSIPNPMSFYWSLKTTGINLRVLPVGLELPYQAPQIEMIGRMPTIQFNTPAIMGTDFWLKRGFDLTVAVLLLIFISPILLLIAALIKMDSPGPIFYKQTRLGLRGRHFKVWKFRTMVINADQLMKELEAKNEIKGGVLFKMKDDPRITKVGKFLRKYSLDELPQLINVLRCQMSLVGPRPLPLRDVEGFAPHHFARQNVLPGITGLWQVSGRSDIIDFENAFRLDVMYINNWSLLLDFQILWKTVQVVLNRKGAY